MLWLGRFTNADPARFDDGLNQYTYSYNNPIVLVDPSCMTPKMNEANLIIPGPAFTGKESPQAVKSQANASQIGVQGKMHWEGMTPHFEYIWHITPEHPANDPTTEG
jgi:hypothetical protein